MKITQEKWEELIILGKRWAEQRRSQNPCVDPHSALSDAMVKLQKALETDALTCAPEIFLFVQVRWACLNQIRSWWNRNKVDVQAVSHDSDSTDDPLELLMSNIAMKEYRDLCSRSEKPLNNQDLIAAVDHFKCDELALEIMGL